MKKIGIIGAGNIGMAIAKGLVNQKVMNPSQLYLSRKKKRIACSDQEKAGLCNYRQPHLVSECDIIILAVLPGQAREVVLDLKEQFAERK